MEVASEIKLICFCRGDKYVSGDTSYKEIHIAAQGHVCGDDAVIEMDKLW